MHVLDGIDDWKVEILFLNHLLVLPYKGKKNMLRCYKAKTLKIESVS